MKKINFLLLLAVLVIFCGAIERFSWASLASNQLVNGSNLQNAVSNGVFTLKSEQSISKTTGIITRSEANTLLNIVPITSDNRGVKKSELVAASTNIAICLDSYLYSSGVYKITATATSNVATNVTITVRMADANAYGIMYHNLVIGTGTSSNYFFANADTSLPKFFYIDNISPTTDGTNNYGECDEF